MDSKKVALIGIFALVVGIVGGYYLSGVSNLGNRSYPGNQNITSQDLGSGQGAGQRNKNKTVNKGNCLSDECLAVDGLEYPAGTLSDEVQKSLLEAINDEYKAHAVYEKTIAKLGNIRPFSMIIRAEESHISSLKAIFDKYGVKIPTDTWPNKVQSEATIAEACKVGVEAEIANAKLYKEKLLPAVKDHADITAVFTNLMNASEKNHLPAFERCSK